MAVTTSVRGLARRVTTERQRRAVLRLRARIPGSLDALARAAGTDKSSDGHDYARLYQRHFAPRRRAVMSVLEIGIGGTTSRDGYETTAGGQSLQMWSRYFPRAQIVGVDIHPKVVTGPRIHVEQGDQSDPAFLRRLVDRYGPFDIVIDDGSHIGRHVIASHAVLWPAVKPGGFYVIEDLATAYHGAWEGGPPGHPGTAVALVKSLVDDTVLRQGDDFQPNVAAVHLYAQIVFLERAAVTAAAR